VLSVQSVFFSIEKMVSDDGTWWLLAGHPSVVGYVDNVSGSTRPTKCCDLDP
jgi:hypothetical protein